MSAISKLKNAFAITATAVMAYGVYGANGAQAYSTGGMGCGNDVFCNRSRIELDYPDGTEHKFFLPDRDDDPAGYEAQVMPLLKNYVANVFPRMPQSVQDDTSYSSFAKIVRLVAGDLGRDAEDLAREIGYDPALVRKFRDFREIDMAKYHRQDLEDYTNGISAGSLSYHAASIYTLSELDVDEVNDEYAVLRKKYPNDPAFQLPDFDYSILIDARKTYAEALVKQASDLTDDVFDGRVDPDFMTDDQKDLVDAFVYSILKPDAYLGDALSQRTKDAITKGNVRHYNGLIPGYIDQELVDMNMAYSDRMKFYSSMFDLRKRFDLRPLLQEQLFLRHYAQHTDLTSKIGFRP